MRFIRSLSSCAERSARFQEAAWQVHQEQRAAQARYQTELGATALLLAAERHRRKTGAWPASANSMAPEILTNPPGGYSWMFTKGGDLEAWGAGEDDKVNPNAYQRRGKP